MTKRNPLSWVSMSIFAIVLSLALVFFYMKTRDYDSPSYFENIALLRQIKQLDARWELDAMKSKVGMSKTYDPLVDPLVDLSTLMQQLEQISLGGNGAINVAKKDEVKKFEESLRKKSVLIERFKSHNAVLLNSLAFLPTAAEDVQKILSGSARDAENFNQIAISVKKVLLASLVYDQGSSNEKADEIESELAKLTAMKKKLPTDIDESLTIFIAHVRTVLREHDVVNNLLKDVALAPTAADIDAINNSLNLEAQQNQELLQQYRRYLLLFSAALVGLFLYAVIRLIRSHAVIQHMNGELQNANDTLEYRVQQRTEELKEVQAKLVTTARQAGMAEIATNVLHNVGNVLNSVNVSAEIISNQLRLSKVSGLQKVVQLIKEHMENLVDFFTNNEKGKVLPNYLAKLSTTLIDEQKTILEELAQLIKSIDHIRDIVSTQQTYAGKSSLFEEFEINVLVEDALRISSTSLLRHRVTIVKEFDDVPPMLLDRHQVLQILINLISNAKNAMHETPGHDNKLTLNIRTTDEQMVQVQVIDNGEGIDPENLSRIFAHGFTTRKDGHGFGLHSCVLAAQGMGGKLKAHSEGKGHGATFTLELPLKSEAV